ncbi:uncharacterized protein F5147DRAFT_820393 [Suillus discolor]|uniref:Uncharacterized protein n=1 Tax=Suillus discolor TaxID=1912936 RepID=A0A9P7JXJ8_9AGAM|nr:uncharacterized protein F5147DRAFT_820393 [Suillus discolor]KAG2115261.1 hypothetical protein F5147DRAFT_820393 [Suillus discolor]
MQPQQHLLNSNEQSSRKKPSSRPSTASSSFAPHGADPISRAVASCGINHTLSCCTLLVAYDVKQLSPTLVLTAGVGIFVAFSLHVVPQRFASRIYGGAYAPVIDNLCTTSDLFTHAIDIFLITIIAYHLSPDLAFSPALASSPLLTFSFNQRLSLIDVSTERDLVSQKERDHGYEDVVENPYQRPTFSFPRRHWKAIFSSLRPSIPSPNVADEEAERVRNVRHCVTRLGNSTIDRRNTFIQHGRTDTLSPPTGPSQSNQPGSPAHPKAEFL